MTRTWTRTGDTWRGYGNGHRATVCELVFTDDVTVDIHCGSHLISNSTHPNLVSGKRWAERHYLKEKKK